MQMGFLTSQVKNGIKEEVTEKDDSEGVSDLSGSNALLYNIFKWKYIFCKKKELNIGVKIYDVLPVENKKFD